MPPTLSSIPADWRHRPTHRRVWALATPMILSNLSVPLVALVDSTVAGHLPHTSDLGAVAVGSAVYALPVWSLGFLRMGTTGFAAQAHGAEDGSALRTILAQALLLAVTTGLLVGALMWPLLPWLIGQMHPSAALGTLGLDYLHLRLAGLPAALLNYALAGWFIGKHDTRTTLALLLVTNLVNIALNLLFVLGFKLGVPGIALASVAGEWCGTLFGLARARQALRTVAGRVDWAAMRGWPHWRPLLAVNRDIFLRTLVLEAVFFSISLLGTRLGDAVVAANALLLNGLLLAAFGLDGLANAVEALCGHAIGARDAPGLRRALVVAGGWALLGSLGFAALFALGGHLFVNAQTSLPAVRAVAYHALPWLAVLPLVGVWSYLLDGLVRGRHPRPRNARRHAARGPAVRRAGLGLPWLGQRRVVARLPRLHGDARAEPRPDRAAAAASPRMDRHGRSWLTAPRLRDTRRMKRITTRIAPLLCLLLANLSMATTPAATGAPRDRSALAARIDAIIRQPRYVAADWGIAVLSLDSGVVLYTHQAGKLFQPASTAKLFTAALTLSTLAADYRIPTRLLSAASVRHGRLDGPLLLYGMGDPTLGTLGANPDWADDLAAQLAARGIREVRGDLVADDSYFAGPSLGSGWEASDLLGWFAAPASALSVHENTVALTVTPAAQAGEPARLEFAPAVAAPPLAGTLTTAAPHNRDDINLYRALGDSLLHAFGSIAAGTPPHTYRLAIPDPAWQTGEELRAALARHHVRLKGTVRVLHWPEHDDALRGNAQVLAEVLSPPVTTILGQGLKRSQNLYLQNLLQIDGVSAQAAAANRPDVPAGFLSSQAWGLHAMHDLLERIGITPSSVLLEEGTGLSRGDLATPEAMVQLLQYVAAQPWAATLRGMLPVAGVDGTLEWRLRDSPATDKVQAKTGSMTHVHSLAGYVTTASGKQLAFAILLNNYERGADAPPANRDIDAIVQLLAGWRD